MLTCWVRKPAVLGLSLAATLAAAAIGCGGGPSDSSDAVVVPSPSASVTSKGPAAPSAAPSPGAAAGASSAASSSAPVKAEGWGTLKGKVVFGGDPPQAKVLEAQGKAQKDPDMCAVKAPIVSERLVVDTGTKGVKNVLVYLPRPTAVNEDAKKSAASATVLFDQQNCIFEPHVLGLMTGVPVTFKSSDPKNHNVNVKLKNSQFNQTIAGGQSFPFTPQSPERMPGPVVCDIHPWMSAWWMVLDHPYFAVTDAQGNYEIKNAPAGTQRVVVWQEAVGFVTAPSGDDLTLEANGTKSQDFTIDSSKVKPGQ
jgi:plastocyanin